MWCEGVVATGWFHEYPGILRDCPTPEPAEGAAVVRGSGE